MGFNVITYGASKNLTESVASGFDHATRTGDNTFSIYFTDGSSIDLTIPLPEDGKDGEDGVSVTGIAINSSKHIVCTMSDNTTVDAGAVPEQNISISAVSGNILEKKSDGYYVGSTGVEISADENNAIKTHSDGLYVADLQDKVTSNENHIGDMTTVAVSSISDLVSYCNVLYNSFMTSITYANKKLTITYRNGATVDIDMSAIITDTTLEEFKNVNITDIEDGQYLSYDAGTSKWVNKAVDLAGTLQEAKDYTDTEIAKAQESNAIACDEKPTYDSDTDTVTYIQSGETKTEKDTTSWFYYVSDNSTCQTRWINGVEFTLDVGSIDLSDYLNWTDDIVSEFAEVPTSLDKVPDLNYLNGFRIWLVDYLAKKVNTADIVDNLTSESTDVPLSANQGKVLQDSKLDNTTSTDNAGKAVVVDDDGNLTFGDAGVQVSEEDDNQIETKSDGIYVDKAIHEVTQAEYDAMSDTAKAGKYWLITDADDSESVNAQVIDDDASESLTTTYSASKIEEIVEENTLNNFGSVVEVEVGTEYTCPSNGIASVGCYGDTVAGLNVNGFAIMRIYGGNQANGTHFSSWRVNKGDVIVFKLIYGEDSTAFNRHLFFPIAE